MLQDLAQEILDVAQKAGSEAKLQNELEPILKRLLQEYGITYDPIVNESLRKTGYSQVSGDRPDSLFGHVVLDYKDPGTLADARRLFSSKKQIQRYLDTVTQGGPAINPDLSNRWAGILWDGFILVFCFCSNDGWVWSQSYSTSEASLASLVQIYRSLGRLPLVAHLLTKYFGKESQVAKVVLPVMCSHLSKPKHRTTMLFREWRRLFEQVSTYGLPQLFSLKDWARQNGIATEDASQILFAMHTYYSLVVKLLTAELLSASQTSTRSSLVRAIANAPSDEELYQEVSKLEDGEFYKNYRISNFLEGDFFSWYTNEKSSPLAKGIRMLAQTFQEFEPATAKFKPETIKDLLKEFYTSLVDEQIRHDLGEYYTPDWLAQYLIQRVGYTGDLNKVVVDPACGSGTFLVECILTLREKCRAAKLSSLQTLEKILHNVRGLDLNPLAVISARANYILSIADLVFALGKDIEIPVYLADAINMPVEKPGGILEYILDTEVEELKFEIPLKLVQAQVLGKIMLRCEEEIKRNTPPDSFIIKLKRDPLFNSLVDDQTEERLKYFYTAILSLQNRKPPWDSIWCRVVKNNFSPKSFEDIDFIVGNPPWVRWSRLPQTYRNRVKKFCYHYGLVSGKGYSGGIESDISTVLTFSAADQWLTAGGKVGFLITWTVFKSSSAKGFRLSKLPDSTGLRIEAIEDLTKIQPFPDATNETAIYIASKVEIGDSVEFTEIPCRIWSPMNSNRINPLLPLSEVIKNMSILEGEACPVAEFGSPLFTGNLSDFNDVKLLRGKSPYITEAHRGTVSDLARAFWVKVEKYSPETDRALIRTLSKKELPRARWVKPVEGAWIEAEVLFPLIRGRDVGRYSFKTAEWHQIIPNRHYARFESEDEFADMYPAAYSYLMNYSDLLTQRATYKRYLKNLPIYSIYCIGEYSFRPYKVVWLEQQDPKKFRATVITETNNSILPNKVIVPDHKLYFVSLDSFEEAHYLCAFLNSDPVRTWLGGFLHGKQIGTTIFEFTNIPKFSDQNPEHLRLAKFSSEAHKDRCDGKNNNFLETSQEKEIADLVMSIVE